MVTAQKARHQSDQNYSQAVPPTHTRTHTQARTSKIITDINLLCKFGEFMSINKGMKAFVKCVERTDAHTHGQT